MLKGGRMKTYPICQRHNLVTLKDILSPNDKRGEQILNPRKTSITTMRDLDELVGQIKKAKENGKPIVWFIGGHVIKCGLSLYLIELIKNGWITHLAGNGAASIHDFELAFNGGTSEDVQENLEDGTFGMWEETGRMMNDAINKGASIQLGYGESLKLYISKYGEQFLHKDISVLRIADIHNVDTSYHIAIGTDFIHQHPSADFMNIGITSGIDFKKFCNVIARLDGGVFLNFGSAVIGPEVFLKAFALARNSNLEIKRFTTANFDLHDMYRPKFNIVQRPTRQGGNGYDFRLDHRVSIPYLYDKLMEVK